MFVRFVRLRVREGQEAAFAEWYGARVIPALSGERGCVFAGLLTPWRGDDHLSLTLWRAAGAAGAYERSGLFGELLREAAPMLAGGGAEPGADREASVRGIAPEGFVVDAGDGAAMRLGESIDTAFVRFVTVRVAPDRIGEFVTAYSNLILPALRAQPGFRGGLLAEERDDVGACVSITLWAREEDAVRYEMSGAFAALTARVQETFSAIYAWPSELAGGGPERSDDARRQAPKVSSYQLVLGKRLQVDGR